MSTEPTELLAFARSLATEASALILDRLGAEHTVDTKISADDLVTEVDRASEELITERILSARPEDGIVGEEGSSVSGTSGVEWVIDPIDGTTSFVYGLPEFCVSIAARVDGEVQAGVVQAPAIGSVYASAKGHGASFDDAPMRCSAATDLARALVGTGFSPADDRRARQGKHLAVLLPQIRDIRRRGSAALELSAVASGQLDAYFEAGLCEWDWSAGLLHVREAGGIAYADHDPSTGRAFVAAAAPGIADEFFATLRELGAETV